MVALTLIAAATVADSAPVVPERPLIVEALRLASEIAPRVWPGWGGSEGPAFELLLVAEGREFLIGPGREADGFESTRASAELGSVAVRQAVYPPGLQATMPAFGLPATIVAGTPTATRKSPTGWLLMLLHEHFHQFQMRDAGYFAAVEGLGLAGDDTSGRWMLDYPFPYDAPEVGAGFAALSVELAALLRRPADDNLGDEVTAFRERYERWLATLDADDRRYVSFQVWQEGVARFVELRIAEEAAARFVPSPAVTALDRFEDFGVAACAAREALFETLDSPALDSRRRVSFYALGAGLALLLDRTDREWKRRYEAPRFRLPEPTGAVSLSD